MQRSYTREQLGGGASVMANCLASSSGGTTEQREEGGRRWPARFITARRGRSKRLGEASSCFAMPPRAGACPHMEEWHEGSGSPVKQTDRQVASDGTVDV